MRLQNVRLALSPLLKSTMYSTMDSWLNTHPTSSTVTSDAQTLKETYPHLDFYGDMFTGGNRPMYGALSEYLVHTSYAADFAHDTLPRWTSKACRLDTYTKGGVGYDEIAEMPVVFYHGTPNGKALRKAKQSW